MKKTYWYDKEEDILGANISNEAYWKSIELPNGIIIDISKNGKIVGLEIANAKKIFSKQAKKVLEMAIKNTA